MYTYLELLGNVNSKGIVRESSEGDRYGMIGVTLRHDFVLGFPLLTTNVVDYRTAFAEMLMSIKGLTNTAYLKDLKDKGVKNNWGTMEFKRPGFTEDLTPLKPGYIGPMFGDMWRRFQVTGSDEPVDQLANVIKGITTDPYGTEHYIQVYHPVRRADPRLTPGENIMKGKGCFPFHQTSLQFLVIRSEWGVNRLNLIVNLSSLDITVGLGHHLAAYGLLITLMSNELGMILGELIIHIGDGYIYRDHKDLATLQGNRTPYAPPSISIDNFTDIYSVELSDIKLSDYTAYPAIDYPEHDKVILA